MNGFLLTIVEFLSPVRCSYEVLGRTLPCTIGHLPCELVFPEKRDRGMDGVWPLHPPSGLEGNGVDRDEPWGLWRALLGAFVGMAGLRIDAGHDPEKTANQVYNELPFWYERLADWLQIFTGQNLTWELGIAQWDMLHGTSLKRIVYASWVYFDEAGERRKLRPRPEKGKFAPLWRGERQRGADAADVEIWQRSLDLASSGIDAPDEYRLLRDAQNALDQHHFRKVAIDAGTAVELALTRALEVRINDPAIAEALMKKFRMLGGRITLARKYELELPETIQTDLVQLRNAATHRYAVVSREAAERALELSREVVETHLPLSSLASFGP
jgi:HEPN domain-containing protein